MVLDEDGEGREVSVGGAASPLDVGGWQDCRGGVVSPLVVVDVVDFAQGPDGIRFVGAEEVGCLLD